MSRLNNEIAKLNEKDTYSLMFFALYKLRNVKEYSVLSELACILEKDALLNLCEYFGGLTLKVPTIDEVESIIYPLVLYQKVNEEGEPYDEVIKSLKCPSNELNRIRSDYEKIVKLMQQYNFNRSPYGY